MRTIPSGFLGTNLDDLQVCIRVVRRDDAPSDERIIRGTESDTNIPITTGEYAGTYYAATAVTSSDVRANSDLSVANLEIAGALTPLDATTADLTVLDLTAADLEAGLFDNADCTVFLVNRANPDLYQHVLSEGWIGNTVRTAEGAYRTEFRGLSQALSQGIVRTYSIGCDAELGDARCQATVLTMDNSVSVVTSRRQFQVTDPIGGVIPISLIPLGKVIFTSGLNDGYEMQIKSYLSLQMVLYLPMPADIQVGDTFTIRSGCNKSRDHCQNFYNNIVNRRAHGVFVPGDFEILRVGKR